MGLFDWLKSKPQLIDEWEKRTLGRQTVRVVNHQQPITFDARAHDSLLEALEGTQGLKVKSSCRNAHCGACQMDLEAGEVAYFKTGDFKPQGKEILACSCVPKTAIQVKFPDKLRRKHN